MRMCAAGDDAVKALRIVLSRETMLDINAGSRGEDPAEAKAQAWRLRQLGAKTRWDQN
jgi:hypothetical protein